MKQKIVLGISIGLGILAAFLTGQYISSQEARLARERAALAAANPTVEVLVPARMLPKGAILQRSDLGTMPLPKRALREHSVLYSDNVAQQIIGKRLVMQVEAMKPLLWTDIEGGNPADLGFASMIRRNMRAMSISVSSVSSVSNMVRPADHVDVIGTFTLPSKVTPGETELVTLTVLQNVLVLATGQTTTQQAYARSGRNENYSMVTLEVSPHEAEVLTFTEQMRGRLTLVLRHPEDMSYEEKLPQVNFDHIRTTLENLNQKRQKEVNTKKKWY